MSATTDIGSKIKKYRKEKKYTLKNLSEQTGLSIGFLSQLESCLLYTSCWSMGC